MVLNKNDDADLWGHGHRHQYDNYISKRRACEARLLIRDPCGYAITTVSQSGRRGRG